MDALNPTPRRVHVLQVLGNAIVGGMEMSLIRLARELPRASFRVSVLCPFESFITSELRNAGCDVLIAPVRSDPGWESIQTAATYVVDEHVDVVHAHLSNAHVLGALVSSLTERPCVATVHGRSVTMLDLEAHREIFELLGLRGGHLGDVTGHHAHGLGQLPLGGAHAFLDARLHTRQLGAQPIEAAAGSRTHE